MQRWRWLLSAYTCDSGETHTWYGMMVDVERESSSIRYDTYDSGKRDIKFDYDFDNRFYFFYFSAAGTWEFFVQRKKSRMPPMDGGKHAL